MARKARKAAPQVTTKVAGVDMAKVNLEQLDQSLERFGFDPDGFASPEHKVQAIHKHMEQSGQSTRFTDCNLCGGVCELDMVLDHIGNKCPYCGDGDETPPRVAVADKSKKAAAKAKPKKKDDEEVVEATGEVIDLDARRDAGPLVPARAVGGKLATEQQLDVATRRIGELKMNIVENYWELGKVIAEVRDKQLWKLRKEGELSIYKTFEQWGAAEIGLARGQLFRHMAAFKAFEPEDVKRIGVGKLNLVLGVSGDDRDRLLKAVREGMPKSELEEAVRKIRGDAETPRPDGLVTCRGPARSRIELFKRASKKDPKRATSIADDPFGEEQLGPVTIRYKLAKDPKGALYLIVERKRGE